MSYAKFLYPTNALVVRKADSHSAVPSCRASASRSLPGSRYKPVTAKTIPAGTELGKDGFSHCHHLCMQQKSMKRVYFSETIASGEVYYWDKCTGFGRRLVLAWPSKEGLLMKYRGWVLGLKLACIPYILCIFGLVFEIQGLQSISLEMWSFMLLNKKHLVCVGTDGPPCLLAL